MPLSSSPGVPLPRVYNETETRPRSTVKRKFFPTQQFAIPICDISTAGRELYLGCSRCTWLDCTLKGMHAVCSVNIPQRVWEELAVVAVAPWMGALGGWRVTERPRPS